MTKIKQVLQMLFAVSIFLIVIYVGWKFVGILLLKLNSINPSVAAAIIGAMATVFAGITAVIITQKQTKSREIAESHREKKVEMYNHYMKLIIRVIKGVSEDDRIKSEGISDVELISGLFEFKRQIILWGSPKVIKAQLEFEAVAARGESIFVAVDNMYRAIREDVGLSNNGLAQFDLFKLFLKDADQMDMFLKTGVISPIVNRSEPASVEVQHND